MKLGRVLADYSYINRIGVRGLAKDIGIPPSTLNRIERGNDCDSQTLAKILAWLLAP